jgi:mono/diheme cytochrome c family protein
MNVRSRDLLLILGAALGASVAVAACSNSPQPAASNCATVSSDCPSPPPSWSKDVQPLVQQYCVMCHQPGGVGESLADLTSYTNVFRARAEITYQVSQCLMPNQDASPPPPQLSTAQRETIVSWIGCMAPNN